MRLKEKFELICGDKIYDSIYSLQCEKIADDYAIEFVKWIRYNAIETYTGWQFNNKSYTDAEILEIFKKENGL